MTFCFTEEIVWKIQENKIGSADGLASGRKLVVRTRTTLYRASRIHGGASPVFAEESAAPEAGGRGSRRASPLIAVFRGDQTRKNQNATAFEAL
jgi:hypothetical protein